jgi:acyl carrier protein
MPGEVDAFTTVRDAVAIVCEVAPDTLSPDTVFADLGADSLARVSIADTVEENLARPGFRIDDAILGRMERLGDLVSYLEQEIPAMAAAT